MKIHTGPKPTKMIPCPTCKGTGKETIPFTSVTPGNVEKGSFDMTCGVCKGKKEIRPQVKRAIKPEQDLWCSCKTSDLGNSIFHDDGECGDCRKHHYHCGTCKKICQVG